MIKKITQEESNVIVGGDKCNVEYYVNDGRCVQQTTCWDKHGNYGTTANGWVPDIKCAGFKR